MILKSIDNNNGVLSKEALKEITTEHDNQFIAIWFTEISQISKILN